MKTNGNSRTAGWLLVGLMSGPVTAGIVWLVTASGFVLQPGEAHKYSGGKGRESDFTELLATAEQTGGSIGVFRQSIAPGSGPPAHVHRDADEVLYVLDGNFKVKVGDKIVDAPAQSLIFVPRGTAHAFVNTGSAPGSLLVSVTPGGYEKYFAEREGADAKKSAELMKAHQTDVVGPPLK
jgi:mannose-6-phosphate isomerase-like protein (cupin superfamily)